MCTFLPFSTCLPHATRLSHLIPPLTFSSFPNHLCLFTCLSFCHITQTVIYPPTFHCPLPFRHVVLYSSHLLLMLFPLILTCSAACGCDLPSCSLDSFACLNCCFFILFFLSIYLSKPLYSHPVLPWCLHLVHLLSCTYIYDTCLILFMT